MLETGQNFRDAAYGYLYYALIIVTMATGLGILAALIFEDVW